MSTLSPELLSRILPAYIRAREEDLRKLQVAVENSDFTALERLGHKIKGSAGTYGFEKTAEYAAHLERAARTHNLQVCEAFIENMAALLFKA